MHEQNTKIWSKWLYSINRHCWEHVQQKRNNQTTQHTKKKIELKKKKKKKKKKKGVNIYVPTRWMGSHPTKSWVHVQLEEKIKRRKNVKIFLGWKWCHIFYGVKKKKKKKKQEKEEEGC